MFGKYRGDMRKIFLSILMTIMMLVTTAYASDNNLNAILLEGTESGYNIILRTDKVAQVKKAIQSDGTLLIDIKNISSPVNIDTRYVNIKNVNNVVVENVGGNDVKIYIQAEGIEKSDIIFETPAAPPYVVSDSVSKKQAGWTIAAFVFMLVLAGSFKKSVAKDEKLSLQKDLTEREIKLYREMKSNIMTSAKIDSRLRQYRASKNVSSPIKRAGTIRGLQNMSCR